MGKLVLGKMALGKMALGKMAGWVKWRRVKWHWVKWNWVNCHVTSSNNAKLGKTKCRPRLECESTDHYRTIEEIVIEDAFAIDKRPNKINRDWFISLFLELLSQNKDTKRTLLKTPSIDYPFFPSKL